MVEGICRQASHAVQVCLGFEVPPAPGCLCRTVLSGKPYYLCDSYTTTLIWCSNVKPYVHDGLALPIDSIMP